MPEIRAFQIDVDHLAPGGRLGLLDRCETNDARVVYQYGDRSEGSLGCGHRLRPVRVARDVEAREDRLIAEFVGERSPLLLDDIRDHDVRALGDEAARVAGTHSTGTTRDDHCPIIETLHYFFSSHLSLDPGSHRSGHIAVQAGPTAFNFEQRSRVVQAEYRIGFQ